MLLFTCTYGALIHVVHLDMPLEGFVNEPACELKILPGKIRVERRLSSSLRALARWGWVALERRQREEGQRFWHNAYWKIDPAE